MANSIQIIETFNNSGLNISPAAFELIRNKGIEIEQIKDFIEDISFSIEVNYISVGLVKKFLKNGNSISNQIDDLIDASTPSEIPSENESKNEKEYSDLFEEPSDITSDSEEEEPQAPIIEEEEEIPENPIPEKQEVSEEKTLEDLRKSTWETISNIRSGTSTFTPLASEYQADYIPIRDPTGHLYVDGKIEDFLNVAVDKFQTLKGILEGRPEGTNLYDIKMVNKLSNSVEIKFVGMVIGKRETSNQNFILEMEDPTGTIKVMVSKKSSNSNVLIPLMQKLLEDHVVIIDGFLKVDSERNSRIVIANDIIFPGVPNRHKIKYDKENLSICLISDTHFGSKDWLENVWNKFIDYLNCNIGTDSQMELAGSIKYVVIAGDLVDGIGVYPNQDKRLNIVDIYDQYEFAAERLAEIPEYITVVVSPGDHDAVHTAIPCGAIPKSYAPALHEVDRIKMVGCPVTVDLHGIRTIAYHGTSLIDMKMSIPNTSFERSDEILAEFLKARHLAPRYGESTQLSPTKEDWLTIKTVPDILHTGHLHVNSLGFYNGILTTNAGCFQGQTDYMKRFGIVPDFGKPIVARIKSPSLEPHVINLSE